MSAHDRLQSVMSGDVVTAEEGATLRELAQTMMDQEVGSVVIAQEGQITGIVSEHDIALAVAAGLDLGQTQAYDVMSERPLCADVNDNVDVTVQRMVEAGVLHMPVMRAGRVCGMLSARDLLARLARVATEPDLDPLDQIQEIDRLDATEDELDASAAS